MCPSNLILSLTLCLSACAEAELEVVRQQDAVEATLAQTPRQEPERTPPKAPAGERAYVEGRDYQVLERVRILDPHGFGQPVEVASFLLPKGWKLEGGITWRVGHPCTAEAVSLRYSARSPDGKMQIDGFPLRSWQWADDPSMRQAMIANQQGFGRTCDVLPPYDATEFVRQVFLPELGNPALTAVAREDNLARAMEERARQNSAALQAQGLSSFAFRPSAVKAHLRWPDGSEGTLLAAVDQTVMHMQDFLRGGTTASYACQSDYRLVMRYPAGQREQAERILASAIGSARVNSGWQQAVQQVFSNIAQVERAEIAKRAGIWREANEYSQNLQRRTWEDSQASRDRIQAQWSQTIRGVDEWRDPYGSQIELSAGYDQAWSRADGTYILSNDPLFDPNVALQEEWRPMEKRR